MVSTRPTNTLRRYAEPTSSESDEDLGVDDGEEEYVDHRGDGGTLGGRQTGERKPVIGGPTRRESGVLRRRVVGRPFVCVDEVCGKAFARKSDLVRHARIHSNERPFVCPYTSCRKSFIQRSALTVHVRTHTGERPHVCGVCQRAFSDSSSLARHRRVHTGARPYKCDVPSCGKTFCRKTTKTKHTARNHSGYISDGDEIDNEDYDGEMKDFDSYDRSRDDRARYWEPEPDVKPVKPLYQRALSPANSYYDDDEDLQYYERTPSPPLPSPMQQTGPDHQYWAHPRPAAPQAIPTIHYPVPIHMHRSQSLSSPYAHQAYYTAGGEHGEGHSHIGTRSLSDPIGRSPSPRFVPPPPHNSSPSTSSAHGSYHGSYGSDHHPVPIPATSYSTTTSHHTTISYAPSHGYSYAPFAPYATQVRAPSPHAIYDQPTTLTPHHNPSPRLFPQPHVAPLRSQSHQYPPIRPTPAFAPPPPPQRPQDTSEHHSHWAPPPPARQYYAHHPLPTHYAYEGYSEEGNTAYEPVEGEREAGGVRALKGSGSAVLGRTVSDGSLEEGW